MQHIHNRKETEHKILTLPIGENPDSMKKILVENTKDTLEFLICYRACTDNRIGDALRNRIVGVVEKAKARNLVISNRMQTLNRTIYDKN